MDNFHVLMYAGFIDTVDHASFVLIVWDSMKSKYWKKLSLIFFDHIMIAIFLAYSVLEM